MQVIPTKVDGVSTLPAAEFNQIPLETTNTISSAGITPSSGDTNQLGKAIANYASHGAYYVDSGTANAKVLSPAGSKQGVTAYTIGMRIGFINLTANTSATVTVNVNGLGTKTLFALDGQNLLAGSLQAGKYYECVYTGSAFTLLPFSRPVVTLAATTALDSSYCGAIILVNCTAASYTISLPQLSTVPFGAEIQVVLTAVTHPNTMTLRGYTGTENIGSTTSHRYWTANDSITVRNVSGKWVVVSTEQTPNIAWGVGTDTSFADNVQSVVDITSANATVNMSQWVDTPNNRVYGLQSGWYLAIGTADFDVSAVGNRQVLVGKNAGFTPLVVVSGAAAPLGIVRTLLQVSGVFYLNGTTDYLQLQGWQNSGGALNTRGDLCLIYLGDIH